MNFRDRHQGGGGRPLQENLMPESNPNDENRQDKPVRPAGRGPGARPPQGFVPRGGTLWLILVILAVLIVVVLQSSQNQPMDVTTPLSSSSTPRHDDFTAGTVLIEDERMVGQLKARRARGAIARSKSSRAGVQDHIKANISRETKELYVAELQKTPTPFREAAGPGFFVTYILPNLWVLLVFAAIYFFIFRGIRNAGGGAGMLGNFGQCSLAPRDQQRTLLTITLADVAGIDEAKDEVTEIIEFLKNPKKFQRLGGRVPRGVLLIGEPGCGKTLLAKATSPGEADVPFFLDQRLGLPSRCSWASVRPAASDGRLFKQAKDSSPCIIFLDEIDAVGRRRNSGSFTGGHDEREQTLKRHPSCRDGPASTPTTRSSSWPRPTAPTCSTPR